MQHSLSSGSEKEMSSWRRRIQSILLSLIWLPSVTSSIYGGHVLPANFTRTIATVMRSRAANNANLTSSQSGNATKIPCSICGSYTLIEDAVIPPEYNITDTTVANMTCSQFEQLAKNLDAGDKCTTIQTLFTNCCTGPPIYQCEKNVRRTIVYSNTEYDKTAPPLESYKAPLSIAVNLTYFSVEEVDVESGTLSIFVWLDMSWKDPRLTWLPGPGLCADVVQAQSSEVWIPHLDLYNQIDGVQELPDSNVLVFPDGTVQWRRNGNLRAICHFVGLGRIPFDNLGCQLIFGDLARFGFGHIEYVLKDGVGLAFSHMKPTYHQFQIKQEMCQAGRTPDNNLFYTLYFKRATNYYVFNIVVPTIILTYVSFGSFLLDFRVGERLSFVLALALVIVAQQIVTADLTPVSDEGLWLDKFVGWSFYWVIGVLVESVLIGYLLFIREAPGPPLHVHGGLVEARDSALKPLSTSSGREEETMEEAIPPSTTNANCNKKVSKWRNWFRVIGLRTYRLRTIDHACFILMTLSYTAYVITMFATIPQWGRDADTRAAYSTNN
jgi:Neurotransmitter-gated ion-channel ligand binding domain